ncbi:hypothetical protein [Dethiothermospora halolimnae]|uniref:hypothetical protein n=1 Tax=Dethiothermospora halolimnae TaxID=3114390 RepID=UPI003CCC1936
MKLYYRFERRKGIFSDEVLSNIQLVLNSFERKGVIRNIIIDKSKIRFCSNNEFEDFYLTPSNVKRRELNCAGDYSLVCILIILILKIHCKEDFKFTADCFVENKVDPIFFRAIKYTNKMLKTKIRLNNTQFIF